MYGAQDVASPVQVEIDRLLKERNRKRIMFVGVLLMSAVQLLSNSSSFMQNWLMIMMFCLVVDLMSVDRSLSVCHAVLRCDQTE